MLDLLRKNTRSWIIYLLFAIIIVVFVFTFNTITPGQACGTEGPVTQLAELASVDGETIDTNLVQMAQSVMIDPPSPGAKDFQAQQRGFAYRGSRFVLPGNVRYDYADFGPDPATVSPIKLEKAMHTLIETILVANEAEAIGLSVSDEELTGWLITSYWFNPDTGEFERKAYENTVRFQIGTSTSRWERFAKRELLREKFITLLVGGLDATGSEVSFHHRATTEQVDLATIVVDDKAAADLVQVADEAVAGWLAQGQDKVQTYFDENTDEFKKPERVEVRGILVRAPNSSAIEGETDPTIKTQLETERTTARQRADGILAELKSSANPEPPAALAAPEEEGGEEKPAEGGDAVAEGDAPAEPAAEGGALKVSEEAFAAAVTTHSDHSSTKDAGGKFDKPRSREDMDRWPFGPGAADPTFALAAGEVSEVIEVPSGFWIVRVDAKLAAEEKTLDQVRNEIAKKLMRQEKAADFKKELADAVLAEANNDTAKSLDEVVTAVNATYGAAEGAGLVATTTGLFSRLQPGAFGPAAQLGTVPGVGKASDLIAAAFAATEEAPLLDQVFSVEEGARLVVARRASYEAAPELDDAARDTIRDRIVREKQKLMYRSWYEGLLTKKLAEGDVDFTGDWEDLLADAKRVFVEGGGALPSAAGDQAAQADTPAE